MKRVRRYLAACGIAAAVACCQILAAGNGIAAPKAPAPATQPAQPPSDPAKVEIARQFIILYHPKTSPKFVEDRLNKTMPMRIAQAKKEDPKLDAKKFERETRARIMTVSGRILDHQAEVVSRHFTMQELKDLLGFFSSPLGSKLLTETPKIQREMLAENRAAKAAAQQSDLAKKSSPPAAKDSSNTPTLPKKQ